MDTRAPRRRAALSRRARPGLRGRLVVGILGAGRMAQSFDAPGASPVRSLAHAVAASPWFSLGGFYDVDPRRAEDAEQRWSCAATPRERDTWLASGWDAIFIATPDERHADDLADALAAGPRAVLVEKPLSPDADRAERLLKEAMRRGIPVLVDYPRRWHSGVAAVTALFAEGALGAPERAIFAHSGGIAHSAVHMIDLMHTWLGGDWNVKSATRGTTDATVSLSRDRVTFEVTFVEHRPETYYLWEVHLYCARGKVELSRSPEMLSIFLPRAHPSYPTHQVLTEDRTFAMESEPLLERAVEHLARLAGDPLESRRHLQRELESQALVAAVLSAAA